MDSERRRKRKPRYERRIFALALGTGVPAAALEATALLRRVMEEIDVAVFAFDEARALRLVNRGGAALLERPVEQLLGKDAAELGLAHALAGDAPRVLEMAFPGRPGVGRWELRRGTFRQGGLPHQLLVLRSEE